MSAENRFNFKFQASKDTLQARRDELRATAGSRFEIMPVEARAIANCTFLGNKANCVYEINGKPAIGCRDGYFFNVDRDAEVTSLRINYKPEQDEYTVAQIYAAIDSDKSIVSVSVELMDFQKLMFCANDGKDEKDTVEVMQGVLNITVTYNGDPTMLQQTPQQQQPRSSSSHSRAGSRSRSRSPSREA